MGEFAMNDLKDFIIQAIHAVGKGEAVINDMQKLAPDIMIANGINTRLRVAHFLAQAAHESGGFRDRLENTNYSESGLLATFPRRFSAADAKALARKPERIANHAYANRNGNGGVASGDGWQFRGRGLFQLTGRANYAEFAKASGQDVITNPDYLVTTKGAVESACWYWNKHNLNRFADKDDVLSITHVINGGYNGLDERKAFLDKIRPFFK
jgi:putative chitinase